MTLSDSLDSKIGGKCKQRAIIFLLGPSYTALKSLLAVTQNFATVK